MRIMFLNHTPANPNGSATHERTQNLLRSYASPGTELDLCYTDDYEGAGVMRAMGSQSILTGLHHAMGTAAHIRMAVWAEQNGYDAMIQSNTFDPGVEPSRLAVRIPVIGVFRATLHVASTLSDRIAITVPLPGHVPYTRRILRTYAMSHVVTDVRSVGEYGEDMDARRDLLFTHEAEVMSKLIADTDAECIIPLGGALIPYVVSPDDLAKEVGVPVMNTKSIGIRFAEMCVSLGLSQSPITYPSPHISPEAFSARAYP